MPKKIQQTNILKDELKDVGENPTAEQILLVSDAFPDLEKSSYAHRGIGLVMKGYDHWESALEQCKKSLENPASQLEHFHALGSVSDAAKQLAYTEEGEGKKAEYIREIKETVTAMAEEFSQLVPQNEEKNTKIYMARSFFSLSEAAILEGDVDTAISVFNDQAKPLIPDEFLPNDITAKIMAKVIEQQRDDKLLEFFASFREKDKLVWLADEETHGDFHHAAVKAGKRELVTETYERLIKMSMLNWNTDFGLRYWLASYYVTVEGNLGRAKELLVQLLEGSRKGENIVENIILESRALLAEVFMEQFRSTADAEEKASILNETMRLAFPTGYIRIEDFDPAMSNTALPAALMLRKMGPLRDFQSTLNKSFDACIAGLTDNEGANDYISVRFFAKVLACLPGLERDAQIASASQFYFLNPEFKPKEEDGESESTADDEQRLQTNGEAADGTAEPDASAADASSGQDRSAEDAAPNDETAVESPAEDANAPYGDIDPGKWCER